MKAENPTLIVTQLEAEHIAALASGTVMCIVARQYYPAKLCKRIEKLVINSGQINYYDVEPTLGKYAGSAIYETGGDPARLDDYYSTAPECVTRLRQLLSPAISPMDLLRLRLQEIWPAGSTLENFHGKLVHVGMLRIFGVGAKADAHVDNVGWDLVDNLIASSLFTQLAANIHLRAAQSGGELVIFRHRFIDRSEHDALRYPGSAYGLDMSRLPPPAVVIKPRRGDLILFDARNVHAVRAIKAGYRVTSSAFIGYRGLGHPLSVFS